ncbi:hypothetical protein CDD82_2927 [Ophiocordyceps australis]|uniref:Uncharacterized protein n=1 Tax=Ophiocordyceps australis TaxID=1399860 RepID=A0A2C5XSY9_9HYPO|nr:hypothetical protein CDD82_2927 [Ophiocordyceps australis]
MDADSSAARGGEQGSEVISKLITSLLEEEEEEEGRQRASRRRRIPERESSLGKSLSKPTPSPAAPPPATATATPATDSIDDAVDAFLAAPRLSQTVRHAQSGRVVSFSQVGDANGAAVFCCVGMGLTRFVMAFYDELALSLKLRLITPDRPGVGASDADADGTTTPLGWPGVF